MIIKKPPLKISLYRQHLKELIDICRSTRITNVQTCWNIGRCITGIEENPEIPTGYGSKMIHLFSKELIRQFGKGYSVTNLKNMRTFSRLYDLDELSPQIDWSSYTLLLSVKDPEARKEFENRILSESLPHRELKKEISRWRLLKSINENPKASPFQLKFNRGSLYTYTIVNNPLLPALKERVTIDCGFNIHKTIKLKNSSLKNSSIIQSYKDNDKYRLKDAPEILPDQLYTYAAVIERIIDGDTLLALIDCGFHTALRMRLRLKGIDAPEIDSKDGIKARAFVEKALKKSPLIGIKTYRADKYSRYLADIFYLPGETDPHKIISEGFFLNQQLIDKGLAIKA